jgi:hypothetical protein
MPSFSTITASLAFLATVTANPVEIEKRKAFSVPQVERGQVLKNGPKQIAKTLRKFGKEVPSAVVDAAAARVSGSVGAVPGDEYDSLYLSPVTVGATTLHLDFDTGSSDL